MGEGPSEKVRWRKIFGRRSEKAAGKVARKGALIPCEEKNNSLIFID